jgi:hypothetical protein
MGAAGSRERRDYIVSTIKVPLVSDSPHEVLPVFAMEDRSHFNYFADHPMFAGFFGLYR